MNNRDACAFLGFAVFFSLIAVFALPELESMQHWAGLLFAGFSGVAIGFAAISLNRGS